MRLEITRFGLRIIPCNDDARDEVFIEEVLGLMHDGDSIRLIRHNASGLSCMGCLETDTDISGLEKPRGSDNEFCTGH